MFLYFFITSSDNLCVYDIISNVCMSVFIVKIVILFGYFLFLVIPCTFPAQHSETWSTLERAEFGGDFEKRSRDRVRAWRRG